MKGVVWQLGRQLDPRAPPWLLLGLGENLVPFANHEESGRVGLGEVNRFGARPLLEHARLLHPH